jgi:hypothetical protein
MGGDAHEAGDMKTPAKKSVPANHCPNAMPTLPTLKPRLDINEVVVPKKHGASAVRQIR